jgi:hypothetical protein
MISCVVCVGEMCVKSAPDIERTMYQNSRYLSRVLEFCCITKHGVAIAGADGEPDVWSYTRLPLYVAKLDARSDAGGACMCGRMHVRAYISDLSF